MMLPIALLVFASFTVSGGGGNTLLECDSMLYYPDLRTFVCEKADEIFQSGFE